MVDNLLELVRPIHQCNYPNYFTLCSDILTEESVDHKEYSSDDMMEKYYKSEREWYH